MTKKEMIAKMAEKSQLSFTDCEKAYNAFVEAFMETAATGESIALNGFAGFTVRRVPERPGWNPKEGKPITVPAHDLM